VSYSEETKQEEYNKYVALLQGGMKEQNIVTEMLKNTDISHQTLYRWIREDDWSLKANLEVLKSYKVGFCNILEKLQQFINSENAVEMGRLAFDVIKDVEHKLVNGYKQHNETETKQSETGKGEGMAKDGDEERRPRFPDHRSPIFDRIRNGETDS